jgi:hypothetical protein
MSPSGYSRDPGKTSAEMRADEQTWKDNMPIVTSCAFAGCDWRYEGTAYEGRELAKGHRRVHHPDAVPKRRRRPSLLRHVTTDDSYREEGRENARKVAAALQRLEDTA